MGITLDSGDQVPSLNEGWKYTLPETSGRWKDVTKYTREMSEREVLKKWTVIVVVSVITMGIFALYLAFTTEGQENIRLLLQHRMVRYWTLQTPPYVVTLPHDVRRVIENFLPLRDFIRFRAVCTQTKASVDKALRTNDNRTSEIANFLLTLHGTWLFDQSSIVKCAFVFFKIITKMAAPDRKAPYWDLFEKNFLSLEQVQSLPVPLGQQIVDRSVQYSAYTKKHAELYFECAAPNTLLQFTEKACQKVDREVLEEFFKEGRAEKLRVAHEASGGTRGAFLSMVLRLVLAHNFQRHENVYHYASGRYLEAALPDITIEELSSARLLVSDKDMYIWKKIEIYYRALKLVQLCVSHISGDELRAQCWQLLPQFRAGGVEQLLDAITTILSSTPEHILSPSLIRRLIYVLNGCNGYSAYGVCCYLLRRWKDNALLCKYRSAIVEEWTHSSDDASFDPLFYFVFKAIDSGELVQTLIVTSQTLCEPRRSLYLRAIAHGYAFEKINIPTKEVFEALGLPFPQTRVAYNEFFLRLNKSSSFFNRVEQLQSQEELEAILDEVLELTDEQLKKVRLSLLARGCEIAYGQVNPLSNGRREAAFKNKLLDERCFRGIHFIELRGVEQQVFVFMGQEGVDEMGEQLFLRLNNSQSFFNKLEQIRSQKELEAILDEVLQLADEQQKKLYLNLTEGCGSTYLTSPLSYDIRKAAFEKKNLDITKYRPTYTMEISDAEKKLFANDR